MWLEPFFFRVLGQFGVCAAEPLIFAPPHPSRAWRGEGRIPFELFLKYTARKEIANASCPPRFARRLICMGFLAKKKRIYQTKYGSSRFVLEMLSFPIYPHSVPILSRN